MPPLSLSVELVAFAAGSAGLGAAATYFAMTHSRRAARARALDAASTAAAATTASSYGASRLPPLRPPNLDDEQLRLYDSIVESRMKVVGREALFDEAGGLRGPWNPQLTSPALGQHLERLGAQATESQADTAFLGDETSLPRGLR